MDSHTPDPTALPRAALLATLDARVRSEAAVHIIDPDERRTMIEHTSLVRLDEVRQTLAELQAVDDVKAIRDKAEAMRIYARQAKLGLESQNYAAEIKIRAERRAGELLATMERIKPETAHQINYSTPSSRPPTLAEIGVTQDQSSSWQRIASLPEEKFEAVISQAKNNGQELTTAGVVKAAKLEDHQLIHQSLTPEWYTPAQYIEAARAVLGHIDTDPASNETAQKIICAGTYYTAETNGLDKDWNGNIWLNPPYGDLAPQFIAKLMDEWYQGHVTQAVVLVNSHATETNWFAPLWDFVLCFTDHRINFESPEGPKNGSTHGSVFIYLGQNERTFYEHFSQFGYVVKRLSYDQPAER